MAVMSTHLIHRVRIKLDPYKPDGQNDAITALAPMTWRGKTTQVECGLFLNDVFVTTVKDQYTALTMRLFNTLDDAPVLEIAGTLPTADITSDEWIAGTAAKTHVTFAITAAQLDLVIDNAAENRQMFYIVVTGTVVTSAAAVVLGLAKLAIMKSGPDLTPDIPTQVCKLRNGSIYLKNRTTSAWHELILDGAAGQEHIRLGEATTLV
jgi:hypothetical protein